MNNGKHGQGTHCTKMGADSLAENTPNDPEFICPICLPKPKSSAFQSKKASLGVRSPYLQLSLWSKKLIKVWDMARYINEGDKIVDKIQPELI